MVKYVEGPELLARYMEEQEDKPQWVTVKDIRKRFNLGREWSSPLSGFLHRIETGPFFSYPFIVVRSERMKDTTQTTGLVLRYLVRRRDLEGGKKQERMAVTRGISGTALSTGVDELSAPCIVGQEDLVLSEISLLRADIPHHHLTR
jgi:hypothetical protein